MNTHPQANTSHLSTGWLSGIKTRASLHIELLLAAVLIAGYFCWQSYDKQTAADIATDLRKSDFVFIDYQAIDPQTDPRVRYIPLKVTGVSADQITFKVGRIGYKDPVPAREHVEFDRPVLMKDFYRQKPLTLTQQQISDFYDQGIVYDAKRPVTVYVDGWIVIEEWERYQE